MILSKLNARSKWVLFSIENRCAAIVASGIARFVPKFIVMRQLKKETNEPFLLAQFTKMYDRMLKKIGNRLKMSKKERIEKVYSTARDEFDEIEHLKNQIWREKDQKDKLDGLKDELDDEKNIFFVCSRHQNPAKDHAEYQGKLYYSEKWAERTKDEHIARYIKSHRGLKSVEEVCYNTPYLVTRPNCKHTLKPVRASTVLSGEWKDEVDYVKDVSRNLTYEKYYERAKFLTEMNKRLPNKEAARDIARTRALMRKHKNKK